MSPATTETSQSSLPVSVATAVLNGVLAVEKNLAEIPGTQKAQIVLDSVAVGAALAPSVIDFISRIVSSFNALGIFHKKTATPAVPAAPVKPIASK